MNPAYPLTCDAWELDRQLEAARAEREPADRRRALEGAVAHTREPFLAGIYGRWAEDVQARMRDRVEKLLLDLGGMCATQGDHEMALGCFRRAAELDEFREATRLAMIEAMVHLGNRRAASPNTRAARPAQGRARSRAPARDRACHPAAPGRGAGRSTKGSGTPA